MMRIIPAAVLTMVLVAAPAAAQEPCSDGRPPTGDLGVRELNCDGGPCAIYGRDSRGFYHRLSIEPRLVGIDAHGPSAGIVRENDVLVAVDQLLVTTPEGGRRLAQLAPNQPVELWLRRKGRDMRVTVTPTLGCGIQMLRVRGMKEAASRLEAPRETRPGHRAARA